MPDEARDRRNVALKFLSDCWRAQWRGASTTIDEANGGCLSPEKAAHWLKSHGVQNESPTYMQVNPPLVGDSFSTQ